MEDKQRTYMSLWISFCIIFSIATWIVGYKYGIDFFPGLSNTLEAVFIITVTILGAVFFYFVGKKELNEEEDEE